MNNLPNKTHLLPREVAEFLRISRGRVYQLMLDGKMPSKKIAGSWRIPRADFMEWYEKQPSGEDLLSA